ncbi:pineapple eye protein-like [Armigeres subalbatus]|uniref:pineapple eye protein-like n=1 Tax=Armigeres subalbatus TaxID=124917 RepID=UPI002ED17673
MRQTVSTPKTASKTETPSFPSSCCFICKSSENDELFLGKFHKKWRIQVHYHCLLLTSNLVQNGDDDEGIFGFMEEEIRNEEARIRGQKCYVCKERYANISCCAKKCFRSFHTNCGLKNGCLSHYVDTFQSWCDKHVELVDDEKHSETESCGICYDDMGPYRRLESVRAPCCHNGWFHRRCVAQFAQSAGYFFKCPLCNNKDDFGQLIRQRGVYIPEKDASWELEPNAFGDQLERPSECDAEECRCRYGRDFDDCKRWDLIMCATCGSTCRHDQCMDIPSKNYVCTFCRPIVGNEPPAAVLELAEASRREEAARRAAAENENRASGSRRGNSSNLASSRSQSEGSDSDSSLGTTAMKSKKRKRYIESSESSASSPVLARKKRNSKNRRTVLESEDSDSDVKSKRKKSSGQRRLSSTSSYSSLASSHGEEISLEEIVKNTPLPRGTSVEKLLYAKPIVRVEKLTEEKIKSLSSSEHDEDEEVSSTGSSAVFDFNYRVKQNKKQRHRSMIELPTIKEVIRSDTDTLTDASVGGGKESVPRPETPVTNKTFMKQFKLKLLGSKSVSRKRSTSESEPDVVAAKKPCPTVDQQPSKTRVSLFPSYDEENTCPNSPRKASSEPISLDYTQEQQQQTTDPSPVKQKFSNRSLPVVFPPTPPKSSPSSGSKTTSSHAAASAQQQKTLNAFFKTSPPVEADKANAVTAGESSQSSAIASSGKQVAKSAKTPKTTARKKFVELDRNQRNLLDYFNRC